MLAPEGPEKYWNRGPPLATPIDDLWPCLLCAVIRQDLNLTRSGVSGANVASVCGAIFARISMVRSSLLRGTALFI